jgi:hypothetical protein
MKRELRVESDGTPQGTKFFTNSGEELRMIKSFSIQGSPDGIEASIEIHPPIFTMHMSADVGYEMHLPRDYSVEQLEAFKKKIEIAIMEKGV